MVDAAASIDRVGTTRTIRRSTEGGVWDTRSERRRIPNGTGSLTNAVWIGAIGVFVNRAICIDGFGGAKGYAGCGSSAVTKTFTVKSIPGVIVVAVLPNHARIIRG